MTAGPLHPDNIPAGRDRILGKGHGTEALGPSDSSDSGSDIQGATDLGDAPESNSDRYGTGEVASSARDTVTRDGADIDTDHIETIPDFEEEEDSEPPKRPGH